MAKRARKKESVAISVTTNHKETINPYRPNAYEIEDLLFLKIEVRSSLLVALILQRCVHEPNPETNAFPVYLPVHKSFSSNTKK